MRHFIENKEQRKAALCDEAIRLLKETLQPLRALAEFQNYRVTRTGELIKEIKTLIKS